ncbi:MAG TPA: polysaccharide pyruvyl transferase family protein [Candidatus Eisenbergiella merdavium]|uniref:Polysaccharide pyruvyl transferase family protein n=1 Tax=Candidatus Eisenbergiella merdavium TaxID=2838551 RepID=A0A9D2SRK2_9FIRM|nr:polysaccharide pyruvyl transferase family protein [Candidatus Eisenbergiella merdavium]
MRCYQGKTDKIVLYMHAGSGNHGCEAIVNTVIRMLPRPAVVMTNSLAEDEAYSLKGMAMLLEERKVRKNFFIHVWYYLKEHVMHDPEAALRYRFHEVCGRNLRQMNISIGGDNYCYAELVKELKYANLLFTGQGAMTVLLGCSIEPELLADPDIIEDMKRYTCIIARESITWQALCQAGLKEKSYLVPDPAFLLPARKRALPAGFQEGNMVGLNVSPMVVEREGKPGITMENYRRLIRHILETTEMGVALIPHVVWKSNDDRTVLRELLAEFRSTGRVVLLEDADCETLKGYISRCRFFIGARTHSTIAAYSSLIPTLVLGYSVKARGIALDLFGTWENYVLPVQSLQEEDELAKGFDWLLGEEGRIRKRLETVMPAYLERARQTGRMLSRLLDGRSPM